MRTTVNIDAPILDQIKELSRKQNRPLSTVISQLLGRALKEEIAATGSVPEPIGWHAQDTGGLMIDLDDKDAVYAILDDDSS